MHHMIDYISATLFNCKDSINFTHLGTPEASFSSGWVKYYLEGCERLSVYINGQNDMMRIQGSIPYFAKGHNFTFSKQEFFEAINYICTILDVDLWQASLEAFEYGVICEVDCKPRDYILHHTPNPSEKLNSVEKEKDKGKYRHWDDSNTKLKMYDAGRNILHKQGMRRRAIIEGDGWDSEREYLKWECHYLRPEYLNNNKALRVYHLSNPEWENIFKEDLYLQYKRLAPMKNIQLPKNKKYLSTSDILAIALAEDGINEGKTKEGIKKMLYAKINGIHDDILSKADKDARKRQIKSLLDKLQEEPISQWDLSDKIQSALDGE